MPILLAGLLAWAVLVCPAQAQAQSNSAHIRELIEREAARQSVSVPIALAFADDESGLKNIVGDMHRPDPMKRAYGPFQLQARFHLLAGEPPRKLLKLRVNIERGVATIKKALERAQGDVLEARLMYVCGRRFQIACSEKRRGEILASWAEVWERWRPRAFTVSTSSALCGTFRATSKGDTAWLLKRNLPRTSSARWSQPRRAGKPVAVSRMGSL
jgi:hypothetical protein